ncbi:MAG TPA: cupin domain-containing protein [Methylomirabilota bacterium]|nr:cupin domain-containing protein [Methylomirabilota bacterium]
MPERERERARLTAEEASAEHYYDYEARFVKQKREQERINILPRVIKPAMFAKGEFALGDMRVFSRYTVAPLSTLTCGFIELRPGAETESRRMIPSLIAYIIDGNGESIQEGVKFAFAAGDVVIIPPHTMYQFVAHPKDGFRAWLPQIRLWHGQGLLWRDPTVDGRCDNESETASERNIAAMFRARRQIRTPTAGKTRYDWFLSRLAEENRVEQENPRVIRGADCSWEMTRQGKVKFYMSRWTEMAARGLDLMSQEIDPEECSGEHRHIFEELLLVVKGRGYDLHEGTKHRWEEGDLVCVPPMIIHRHVNDGKHTAHLVSVWSRQPGHELLGGVEQISDASDWRR